MPSRTAAPDFPTVSRSAAGEEDPGAGGAKRGGGAHECPGEAVRRGSSGERDDEDRRGEATERECCKRTRPPPHKRAIAADPEPRVARPRRELAAEKQEDGDERSGGVDPGMDGKE